VFHLPGSCGGEAANMRQRQQRMANQLRLLALELLSTAVAAWGAGLERHYSPMTGMTGQKLKARAEQPLGFSTISFPTPLRETLT
jgi:FtsH-binding integral membrane protein